MQVRSLGAVSSAVRGITLASATSPTGANHVATLNANHQIPSIAQHPNNAFRRIAIFGCTGGTSINGIWTARATGANTFALEGSVANGTAVVTTNAVVAAVMDSTPFMRGHSAVAMALNFVDLAPFDGTFAVMGNRSGADSSLDASDAAILASDATTLATYFEDCVSDVAWSVPGDAGAGTTDGITEFRNVTLRRMMYLNCSARTAGGLNVVLLV